MGEAAMKKKISNCFLVLLSIILVTVNLPVAIADTVSLNSQNLFFEEFSYAQATNALKKSAMVKNGWTTDMNNTTASYNNGSNYTIPSNSSVAVMLLTNGVSKADFWRDYSVSADFSFGEGTLNSNTMRPTLVARATNKVYTGYEFGIRINSSGVCYILNRKTSGDGSVASLNKTQYFELERNTVYHLTLTVFGDNIYCYSNNELIFNLTDTVYSRGYAGFRMSESKTGIPVSMDDFSVDTYNEQTETAIFSDDFSSYTQQTPALKAAAMRANGWSGFSNAVANYAANGAYTVPAGSGSVHFISSGAADARLWGDYTASAQLTVSDGEISSDIYAGISVRCNEVEYSGYEYSIFLLSDGSTGVRLYRRKNVDGTVKNSTLAIKALNISRNKTYELKIKVEGSSVICYLDGQEVLTATDSSYVGGCMGIKTITSPNNNVAVTYDNVAVFSKRYVYMIGAECGAGGTISPEGNASVNAGSLQSYSITPDYGYVIDEVAVDGVSLGPVSEYVFTDVAQSHTITAAFRLKKGDFDNSGECDAVDVMVLRKKLLESVDYSADADMNSDGSLNIVDLVKAKKKICDLPESFMSASVWNFLSGTSNINILSDNAIKCSSSSTVITALRNGSFGSDYSVSADITLDESNAGYTYRMNAGLIARRTGNQYYEYRIYYQDGEFSLELYRYTADGSQSLRTYNEVYINELLRYEAIQLGKTVNLRLLCKGNNIHMFINDNLVDTYVDISDKAVYNGVPGLKVYRADCELSGFEVQAASTLEPVGINAYNITDSNFNIYQGETVYHGDYYTDVVCKDGTLLSMTMNEEMLSDYDNITVGEKNVTLALPLGTIDATVTVKERNEFISSINTALENVNSSELTEENIALINDFAKLSVYEKGLCSSVALENHNKLSLAKAMRNVAGDELLYNSDFDMDDQERWDSGGELKRGASVFVNGNLCLEQTEHKISTNCWRSLNDVYGEIHSVSARVAVSSFTASVGLSTNVNQLGYYYCVVRFANDENGTAVPTLRLCKVTYSSKTLVTVYPRSFGVDLTPFEWFDLEMVTNNGVIEVYINGIKMVSYDDSADVEQHLTGTAGIYGFAGNCRFDNFYVCGLPLEDTIGDVELSPTNYNDDFENADTDSAYWIEGNTTDLWGIHTLKNSKRYGIASKAASESWLHVFETNPRISLDFIYRNASSNAKFGFEIRKSGDTAYVRIGYDKFHGKWYITETECETDCTVNTVYAQKSTALAQNAVHTAEIIANGGEISVCIDGINVLTVSNVTQQGMGRIGLFTSGTEFYIDNFECVLPNGDNVSEGLLEYFLVDDYSASMELETLSDGTIVGAGYDKVWTSYDNGKTFTEVSSDSPYTVMQGNGAYPSLIKLHDGSYLEVKSADMGVYRSEDEMQNWQKISEIVSPFDSKSRNNAVVHLNSITEIDIGGGKYRIFVPVAICTYEDASTTKSSGHYTLVYYSDDGGVSWTASENDTRDILNGYKLDSSWAESKVIRCSDGTLRMYYSRNELGCVQYTESYDNGVTWVGQGQIPQMQTAFSSYSIVEDDVEKGTYYMVWVNDTPLKLGAVFARSRLSLARSRDGKNWEFLCDVERVSPYVWSSNLTVSSPVFQIIDPSIKVTKDHILVTYGCSDRTLYDGNQYHNGSHIKVVRLDKDKLTSRAWDAFSLSSLTFTQRIELIALPQTQFAVGSQFFYEGGQIRLTALDESVTVCDTARFYLKEQPDMSYAGQKQITLYNRNGFSVTYTITVS